MGTGRHIACSHEYGKKQYMPQLLCQCTLLLPSLGFIHSATGNDALKDVCSLPMTVLISLGLQDTTVNSGDNCM